MAGKTKTYKFEGKTYTVPADASLDEVQQFIDGQGGGSSPSGAGTAGNPPAPQSLWDKVKGSASNFFGGMKDAVVPEHPFQVPDPGVEMSEYANTGKVHPRVPFGNGEAVTEPINDIRQDNVAHGLGRATAVVAPMLLGARGGKPVPEGAPPPAPLEMPMAPELGTKMTSAARSIPKPSASSVLFHPAASTAAVASRGLLGKVGDMLSRVPEDPNVVRGPEELIPSRPQPITAEQSLADQIRRGEAGTTFEGEPPAKPNQPELGRRQSLAERVGVTAGRPEPNVEMVPAHEPTGLRPRPEPVASHPRTPLWQQMGVTPSDPSEATGGVQVSHPPEPQRSMAQVANPERDTNVLHQVQAEMPQASLSQQLQEAARRVNPQPSKPLNMPDLGYRDLMDDQAIREEIQSRLPLSDEGADSLRMREFYSRNKPGTPKRTLIDQLRGGQ